MRAPFDPSLCLVTDHRLPFERQLRVVEAALAGGVTMVQLRNPEASARELVEQARALRGLLRPRGLALIVNDRADVAFAAGAAGVHLGQSDLPVAAARALLGPAAIIGLSITEPGQAEALDASAVDYLGAGPVFATSTKPDAAPPLGLEALAGLVRRSHPLPVVAIGGIGPRNAAEVARTGVAGLAVVSAISAAADPAATSRALREALTGADGPPPGGFR